MQGLQPAHRGASAGRRQAQAGGWRCAGAAAPVRGSRIAARAQQKQQAAPPLAKVPLDYAQAVRQAQAAVKAAVADGVKLIEVEFPTLSLTAAQGDGEGQNEMNAAMDYLRKTLVAFQDQAATTRVFFPDQMELAVARSGQTSDPSAGRVAMDAKFEEGTKFKFGVLTKQNAAWAALGVNIFGSAFSPVDLVKDTDEMFWVAYPSFNPREELSATYKLWTQAAEPKGRPLVVFNGELDRIRGGYYPAFAFGELAKLSKDFIPNFEAAFYIRNFKGSRPGVLFRQYPGPWQVLRRNPVDESDLRVVWTGESRPTLREVALDILPGGKQ